MFILNRRNLIIFYEYDITRDNIRKLEKSYADT